MDRLWTDAAWQPSVPNSRLKMNDLMRIKLNQPNDPKLSHGVGDCRQPKDRSEN
jgi:hypothetical protein